MSLTLLDVFDNGSGCHHFDIDRSLLEKATTIHARGGCDCQPWTSDGQTCGSYCDSGSVALGRLEDGRFVVISESSDTTGHGCQCSGTISLHPTYEQAWSLGLDQDAREMLKYEKREDETAPEIRIGFIFTEPRNL